MSKEKKPVAAKPEKKIRVVKESRNLRYNFTDAELLANSQSLGTTFGQRARKDEEFTAVKSQFKSELNAFDAQIAKLSQIAANRFEFRNVPCEAKMHVPCTGKKTVTRMDTHEVVAVETMSEYECQEQLDLDKREAAVAPANPVLTVEQANKVIKETNAAAKQADAQAADTE